MRTFYIFKIKNEYVSLTKNNPYQLYKMLSYIYHLDKKDIYKGKEILYKIVDKFNEKEMDIHLFKCYRENYFYTKFKNIHQVNNFYKKEESKLIIKKSFLLLQSSVVHPTFLNELTKFNHLFFCDFENIDFFWLDKLFV